MLGKGEEVIEDVREMFAKVEEEIVGSLREEEEGRLMELLRKVNEKV